MTVIELQFQASVSSRSDTAGRLRTPGDAIIVERGKPRLMVMMCPDGCGEELAINLDSKAGPAWKLYRRDGVATLFPSVWRDTGCESHFIVSRDRIYLFSGYDRNEGDDSWYAGMWAVADQLDPAEVLGELSSSMFMAVDTVSDRLGELPWDVHRMCRRLVSKGLVVEGKGVHRGQFRRI